MRSATQLELQGRDEELATLRDSLASAGVGRGRLIVIAGEAGTGKTVLADTLAREAAARATVVCGRAWELSEAPPYFPLWPCLRSLGVEVEGRPPFAVWEIVLAALASATMVKPAVWIVEDLHVADLQTLDLLAFLARPLRALPALVAVTVRSHDPRLGEEAMQRIARMANDGLELRLGPLARDEVAAVATQCAGRPLAATIIDRLALVTGGNPLFVTECARAMSADRVELPATVRQAILERVALLPAPCREILTAAAVVGRELTAARVARMLGTAPARIADGLLPALRAGLVDELEPGRFAFRHVLVRDALEDAASAETRVALHARAEQALAAEGDAPELLVEQARHALAAASPADAARVLALARRAAAWLDAHGAFDRAYAMHDRIDQARRAGLLPLASPDERLDLVRIAREAGRHGEARRICDDVAGHARATNDAVLLGRAAWTRGEELQPGIVDGALVAVLEEALAGLPPDQAGLRCRLQARLAAARQPAPDEMVAVELARAAIAAARLVADEQVVRDVLYFAGAAMVDVAPLDERLAVSRELLDRSRRTGDVTKALRAHARLAVDRVEGGDFAAFDDDVEQMLEISSAAGHARHRWRPLLFASMRALMFGRALESERYVTEAAELVGLTDDPALGLSLAAHRLRRARLLHHDDETFAALRAYEHAMQGVWRSDLVVISFRLGCLARMMDRAAVAVELEQLGGRDEALWRRGFHAWLAEAYALAGNEEQRRRARAFFAAGADRSIVVSHVALTYEGPTLRLLGLLDASLGDVVAGEQALRRAAAEARARGHRLWVAQLRFDLAAVLLAAGRAGEAHALLAEVAVLARELGMEGLARRASELAPAGPPPAWPTVAVTAAPTLRMVLQGDVWCIEHDGKDVVVRDSRGLRLLARLIECPRQEIHVLVLASDEGVAVRESSAGEVLDRGAREAYRRRLADLSEQLDDAERRADLGRVTTLRAEQELLELELFRAVGLGGRARHARSATERARVNVQRRLKDAVARIAEVAPALGSYLATAVRTGTYCSFRP